MYNPRYALHNKIKDIKLLFNIFSSHYIMNMNKSVKEKCITLEEIHIDQSNYRYFLFFESKPIEEVLQQLLSIKKMSTFSTKKVTIKHI